MIRASLSWLKRLARPRVIALGRIKLADLPSALLHCSNALSLDIGVLVGPQGNTEKIIFLEGDGRAFLLVEEAASSWRWRTLLARGTEGVFVRFRCVWRGHKPLIQSFTQFPRKTADRSAFSVEAERTGVETWLEEVKDIGWTGWSRVLLTLNPDGSVADAKLVEGHGAVGQTALRAAQRWKFRASSQLPQQLTLSLASAGGKPFVRYGVLSFRVQNSKERP